MPKTKIQKQQIVIDLTDKLNKATSVAFTDYQGLTMGQLAQIRSGLLETSGQYSITKNNLLKLALKDAGIKVEEEKMFEGPIATLFSFGDEVASLKVLTKSFGEFQLGKLKGGIIDGEFIDANKIKALSSLPGKDELRAKVVGSLGAPLYGIVGVLQGNLRNLVYALDQIRISKGGEAS